MGRAYGSSAHLLMKRETAYGQAATGDYIRMPFNRCNLGSEQGLIDDPVLGQGRDPLAPLQDVINDEGDIVAPVARIEDPAERVRLAFKLFDSEGVALVNLLRGGSDALEEMRGRARDLGIVLDEALVRDAERARTKLD